MQLLVEVWWKENNLSKEILGKNLDRTARAIQ
jgi:hypothetical protein